MFEKGEVFFRTMLPFSQRVTMCYKFFKVSLEGIKLWNITTTIHPLWINTKSFVISQKLLIDVQHSFPFKSFDAFSPSPITLLIDVGVSWPWAHKCHKIHALSASPQCTISFNSASLKHVPLYKLLNKSYNISQ
jgi:hypothetical protein